MGKYILRYQNGEIVGSIELNEKATNALLDVLSKGGIPSIAPSCVKLPDNRAEILHFSFTVNLPTVKKRNN